MSSDEPDPRASLPSQRSPTPQASPRRRFPAAPSPFDSEDYIPDLGPIGSSSVAASTQPKSTRRRDFESVVQQLQDYIEDQHERAYELEVTLPAVDTMDAIYEYELLIKGASLVEIGSFAADEAAYENEVDLFLETLNNQDLTDDPIEESEVSFDLMYYKNLLQVFSDILMAVVENENELENLDLYTTLKLMTSDALGQLEKQLIGSPEAVQLLKIFVKLQTLTDLLPEPGMASILEPYITQLLQDVNGMVTW